MPVATHKVYAKKFKNNYPFIADNYAITATNSHGIDFLFLRAWKFQFYVVMINGNPECLSINHSCSSHIPRIRRVAWSCGSEAGDWSVI